MARRFTKASGESVRFPVATPNNLTGQCTLACIIKLAANASGNGHMLVIGHNSGGNWTGPGLIIDIGGVANRLTFSTDGYNTKFTNSGATLTITTTDNWVLTGVNKASGTATPKFHKYAYGTDTWVHVNGAGTVADGTAPGTTGTWQLGQWQGIDNADVDMAVAAVWDRALSDAEWESLAYSLQAWIASAPVALWVLDQQAVAQNVPDHAGNSHQSARTGTTVSANSVPLWNTTDGGWLVIRPQAGGADGTASAGVATASGVAYAAVASGAASASAAVAVAAATAYPAVGSVSVTAGAGVATATGTANGATATGGASATAGVAVSTATANAATGSGAANAGAGVANAPAVAHAATASGSGSATANAGVAAATAQAYAAVAIGDGAAAGGVASATGAAYGATATGAATANAGLAGAVATAHGVTGSGGAAVTAGLATATASAYPAAATGGAGASAGLAVATAAAHAASATGTAVAAAGVALALAVAYAAVGGETIVDTPGRVTLSARVVGGGATVGARVVGRAGVGARLVGGTVTITTGEE